MCTSPGDVIIVHANITPLGILLREASLKGYAWLVTRPPDHPISPLVLQTIKHQAKKHHTLLHHLANVAKFRPKKLEKIATTRQHPGTTPNFSTHIAVSKEESIVRDKESFPTGRMIYTDSSRFKGAIGAVAVLFTNGIRMADGWYSDLPPAEQYHLLSSTTCWATAHSMHQTSCGPIHRCK